jgi:hypothetical protein
MTDHATQQVLDAAEKKAAIAGFEVPLEFIPTKGQLDRAMVIIQGALPPPKTDEDRAVVGRVMQRLLRLDRRMGWYGGLCYRVGVWFLKRAAKSLR